MRCSTKPTMPSWRKAVPQRPLRLSLYSMGRAFGGLPLVILAPGSFAATIGWSSPRIKYASPYLAAGMLLQCRSSPDQPAPCSWLRTACSSTQLRRGLSHSSASQGSRKQPPRCFRASGFVPGPSRMMLHWPWSGLDRFHILLALVSPVRSLRSKEYEMTEMGGFGRWVEANELFVNRRRRGEVRDDLCACYGQKLDVVVWRIAREHRTKVNCVPSLLDRGGAKRWGHVPP